MVIEWIRRKGTTAMTAVNTSHRARIVLAALVLILGAYWAGARYGLHEPTKVEALPSGGSLTASAQRDASLTYYESINVRIYRQTSPAGGKLFTQGPGFIFFMYP